MSARTPNQEKNRKGNNKLGVAINSERNDARRSNVKKYKGKKAGE